MRASLAQSPLTSHQISPQRLAPLSPLTTDRHQRFEIPKTEPEADGMLAAAESRMATLPAIRGDVAADLARFLGASSRVWTPSRRARLHRIIVSAGGAALGPVFVAAAAAPREEVIDAAVSVVAAAANAEDVTAVALVHALLAHHEALQAAPIVREVMARALARSANPITADAKVRVLFILANQDPSPAMREVAIQALAMVGGPAMVPALVDLMRQLEAKETDKMVLRSIGEALETLQDR